METGQNGTKRVQKGGKKGTTWEHMLKCEMTGQKRVQKGCKKVQKGAKRCKKVAP